jgi:predicted nucleic acid-binding protein
MKALDTSVLLALLEGESGVRELLRRLHGVEIATTEANLLELAYLATRGPERHRVARRDAIARLRRKITVLPIDARAVDATTHHLGKGGEGAPPLVGAMMGALEASGCEELLTLDPPPEMGKWKVRVNRIPLRHAK